MAAIFEADPEGFREQNAGRPAAHLVRELVQNVFDEKATKLEVNVDLKKDGVEIRVKDDVPGGIRDPKLVFTIWLSDKKDTPTKRGRMGRGLKEIVSVSDKTSIITQDWAVSFTRKPGGDWVRGGPDRRTDVGTLFEAKVNLWKQEDVDGILTYLRRMRPPEGLQFIVNGLPVTRKQATESYPMSLTTVMYEEERGERISRERKRDTVVDLFDEPEHWVYEMGIPVEQIEFPMSIDVGQRIPLRERRDTMTDPYRKELFAKLVDRRIAKVEPEQMRDKFILDAAAAPKYLSEETKQRIATAWTEGRPFASNPDVFRAATGQHVAAISLRQLPEPIREVVRDVGVNVQTVLDARRVELCPPVQEDELRPGERKMVKVFEWIAAGIGKPCSVTVAMGSPSAEASFDNKGRRLTLYREPLTSHFFGTPYGPRQLGLLIHELAHWKSHEHGHGFDFHSDAEDVGGAVAAFLLENAEKAKRLLEAE